jgi:hypothetical protein
VVKVTSNRNWRVFLDRFQVPKSVLEPGGDLDWANDESGFFKYRGTWYHTSQFQRVCETSLGTDPRLDGFAGWDGFAGDSYFSGVVLKLDPNEPDRYQVGTYIVTTGA